MYSSSFVNVCLFFAGFTSLPRDILKRVVSSISDDMYVDYGMHINLQMVSTSTM